MEHYRVERAKLIENIRYDSWDGRCHRLLLPCKTRRGHVSVPTPPLSSEASACDLKHHLEDYIGVTLGEELILLRNFGHFEGVYAISTGRTYTWHALTDNIPKPDVTYYQNRLADVSRKLRELQQQIHDVTEAARMYTDWAKVDPFDALEADEAKLQSDPFGPRHPDIFSGII